MRKTIAKKLRFLLLALLLMTTAGLVFLGVQFRASLPVLDGERALRGLGSPVTVTSDRLGIPTIYAQSRLDAFRALGYVTARDRLFQMDLMRRAAAGRLSEVIGKLGLEVDIKHRVIGFHRVAPKIVEALPEAQREALKAYAEGVNAFIREMKTPPFEFVLLSYRPDPWTVEDSVLVYLNMFESLYGYYHDERMMTVMQEKLPKEVVDFLTPDIGAHDVPLLGGSDSFRPIRPIPVEALAALRRPAQKDNNEQTQSLEASDAVPGSNHWAINKSKTSDGRAILANDMHLGLSVPNIWYRASLQYEDVSITGVTLPGTPPVIVGSNGHVAWGFTVLMADILDLVRLELNPKDSEEYKTPKGWKRFDVVKEQIEVRWGKDVVREVRQTIWGPVLEDKIAGASVALHWTALDPQGVDIGLLEMDRAKTLEEGIRVLNQFRGPPLNALIADDRGQIAWTVTGRIPIRRGFDGTSSASWADAKNGWEGYIFAEELPRVVDPPNGFLATANNRVLGKGYPYPMGYNFGESYRAYRIQEHLQKTERATESQMFKLQLDTSTSFFDFYKELALKVLTDEAMRGKPLLIETKKAIEVWDGRAEVDSRGFGLLVQFRNKLDKEVFDPFLSVCREADPLFSYQWWYNRETPLRMMLSSQIPNLNPDPEHYPNWESFILGKWEEVAHQIKEEYPHKSLDELGWGEMNRAQIVEPLFEKIPLFGRLFKMSEDPLPGCAFCIRVVNPQFGASERMVVSPGHEKEGILHMPGGQSGHALSPNYSDQHPFWVKGEALPFLTGPLAHTLTLKPEKSTESQGEAK